MKDVKRPVGCECNWLVEECCDACAHMSKEQEARILAAEAAIDRAASDHARDAAWARLVASWIAATNAAKGQSAILASYAERDIESAEEALRSIGVDAHALILEAINDPSLFRHTAP